MTILHILRDKFLNMFGIDELLDELIDNERNDRIADLKNRDEAREMFKERMRLLIEAQKRFARESEKHD